jgi:hypothetical protein
MRCTLLITVILGRRPILLLGRDLLHLILLLGLSGHLLCGSRVLLLAVQHPKKLLLSLPRGHYALQIKT